MKPFKEVQNRGELLKRQWNKHIEFRKKNLVMEVVTDSEVSVPTITNRSKSAPNLREIIEYKDINASVSYPAHLDHLTVSPHFMFSSRHPTTIDKNCPISDVMKVVTDNEVSVPTITNRLKSAPNLREIIEYKDINASVSYPAHLDHLTVSPHFMFSSRHPTTIDKNCPISDVMKVVTDNEVSVPTITNRLKSAPNLREIIEYK